MNELLKQASAEVIRRTKLAAPVLPTGTSAQAQSTAQADNLARYRRIARAAMLSRSSVAKRVAKRSTPVSTPSVLATSPKPVVVRGQPKPKVTQQPPRERPGSSLLPGAVGFVGGGALGAYLMNKYDSAGAEGLKTRVRGKFEESEEK